MAGGAGTRFWPASRSHRPKQLLALAADPNESLLAATVRRLDPLIKPENVFIATGAHLLEASAKILPKCSEASNFGRAGSAEMLRRALSGATATIARNDPDAIVCVLPSDHFMADEEEFRATMARAIEAAKQGYFERRLGSSRRGQTRASVTSSSARKIGAHAHRRVRASSRSRTASAPKNF